MKNSLKSPQKKNQSFTLFQSYERGAQQRPTTITKNIGGFGAIKLQRKEEDEPPGNQRIQHQEFHEERLGATDNS